MITSFNVISADGYIAREDGDEDFIPDGLWPTTLTMFGNYDALVMGGRTYKAIQEYPRELLEPLESLPIKKVVVTTDTSFEPKAGYECIHSLDAISVQGSNVLVSSGPTLNTALLQAGLLDQVIHHRLSVEIGAGIRPFSIDTSILLTLVSRKELEGVEELVYAPNYSG